MRKKIIAGLLTCIAVLGMSHSALAHHGRASYDDTKVFTLMGTVSSFQFLNPHAQLFLDVKDDKGNIEKWVGEGTSPNMLVREGWDRKTIKPGDRISVTGHSYFTTLPNFWANAWGIRSIPPTGWSIVAC